MHNEQDQYHGERYLNNKKHYDDGNQHQGRPIALRQAARLAAPVLLQQQLATPLGPSHGADQQRGKNDESRTRDEVNENDAEPEVDVEIDVGMTVNERCQLKQTAAYGLQSPQMQILLSPIAACPASHRYTYYVI